MDSIEVTKVSTAVLIAGIAFFVTGMIGANVVHPEKPHKPAIEIKGVVAEGPAAAHEAALAPIGPLLAAADPAAGEASFKKLCVSCHTATEGGKAGVGPNLYGVVGGTHGAMAGFNYSAGMKEKTGTWSFEDLNQWLHKPASFVKGTRMAFAGISNDKARADMIAYLTSLSKSPGPAAREVIPDTDALIAAAEAAADVAGAVIRPFFRAGVAADTKSDRSPVTIADRTAEQAMRAVLAERLPDHGVLGEEFGLDRPNAAFRWVLDPVDGTRAFISGRPTFGTLIALFQDDRPILGIIDQPVTGERWIGALGRKTIFRGPFGGKIGCRPCGVLANAELSCTSPEMLGDDTPRWDRLKGAVRRNYWGGDCYAYGLLALGQIDIIAESDMKVWDWGPLVPVILGAGGVVTDWNGQPLRPDGDGRVLAVGDPSLQPAVVAALTP